MSKFSSVRPADGVLPFAILLAGGQGTRLHELTERDAKPAVPFAGAHRIVDFAVANVVRARLPQLLVATQYRPETLHAHLDRRWRRTFGTGLLLREGPKVTGTAEGYRGTADAVLANLRDIRAAGAREVLVLAGDHVCDVDYRAMLSAHRAHGRPATLAVTAVPLAEARAFGVVSCGTDGSVARFTEKPQRPDAMPRDATRALVSLGFYLFDVDWLAARLEADAADPASQHDFGHSILPTAVAEGAVGAWRPEGTGGRPLYWRDVGTLDAYRLAQLDFGAGRPPCALPAEGDGPVPLSAHALLQDSVVLPGASVGASARLRRSIVGPGAAVPRGLVVGEDPREDARWFRRTESGTTLITAEMLLKREATRSLLRPAAALSLDRTA